MRAGAPSLILMGGAKRPHMLGRPGLDTLPFIGPAGPKVLSADRVVLACGAIGTARLLRLSGIGPESMLRALDIDLVVPAPVGMHCADHPEWVLPVNWTVAADRPVLESVLSVGGLEIRAYTTGFAAMTGGQSHGQPDWPHLGVALMKPRSRGRVSVVSADPMIHPRIEHRYDSEPQDVAQLAEGAAIVRELTANASEVGQPAWSTSQHLCASAPMGADSDPHAVVDAHCRVRGVKGLWVIDGSILPGVPSRGPHATTVMLGHRAAAFVTAAGGRGERLEPGPGRDDRCGADGSLMGLNGGVGHGSTDAPRRPEFRDGGLGEGGDTQ